MDRSRGRPTRRLLRGVTYITVVRGLTAMLGIGTIGMLTRTMSKEHLGIYFIILQIANIAMVFSKLGTDDGNQRFIATAVKTEPGAVAPLIRRQQVVLLMGTAGTLALIAAFWIPLARHVFHSEVLLGYLLIQLLVVATYTSEWMQSSTLRALDWLLASALTESWVRQLVTFVALGLLFLFARDRITLSLALWIYLAGGLVNIAVGLACVLAASRPYRALPPPQKEVSTVWEIIRISIPMGMTNGLNTVRNSASVLIVGAILGPEAAGLWGPVRRVANLVGFLLQAINKMLAPIVAPLYVQGKLDRMQAVCRRSATMASAASIPIGLFFALAGEWFLVLVFGEKFAGMGVVLLALMAGPLAMTLIGSPGVVLRMTKFEVRTMNISLVTTATTLLGIAAAAYWADLFWVAVVSAAMVALQFLWLFVSVRRQVGIYTHATFLPPYRSGRRQDQAE